MPQTTVVESVVPRALCMVGLHRWTMWDESRKNEDGNTGQGRHCTRCALEDWRWLSRSAKCQHSFVVLERIKCLAGSDPTAVGYEYVMRCTRCGDMRTHKV